MVTSKLLRMACAGSAVLGLAAFGPERGAATPAPPRVRVVRMVMNGTTPRFQPATVTIHRGDRVRFVVVSGAPHNVSFDPAALPADMRPVLAAAMRNQMQRLAGPLLVNNGDS
jgi:plastocyanin